MAEDADGEPDRDGTETEEDWFERGVREAEEADGAESEDEPAPGADVESEDEPAPGAETETGPGAGFTPDGADDGPEGDVGPASGDDLFEEDFADALSESEGPAEFAGGEDAAAEFGFGGMPGGEGESFDDEDLDSDIPRIDLGVEGLDAMIQGGVPERSLIAGIGGPGTGKTTFGLQFLEEAVSNGESAVLITLEESRDHVLSTAAEKGWDFPGYVEEGRLVVVDLDPVEMANSLASIRSELPSLVEDFGASRLVLDSVSLLEMMYDSQARRRTEIYDFTRALKEAGVTTYLTSEASADNPYASRHGIIEYLTDAVFVLRYVRSEDFHETRLAVEIQKIRDANHSRETKPYEITDGGINVYRQANLF